jgi:photosystem II stability/assembly factor-like uncharacterized protein
VNAADPWRVVSELRTEHQFALAGFANEEIGITVEAHGLSHYSHDGGQTWTLGEGLSRRCRYGLDIVDDSLAWTTGHRGVIQVSHDGGKSWQTVAELENNERLPALISFLDARVGWVASSNQLWSTGDGGQTWTELVLPATDGNVIAIVLRTASDGYLLDRGGTLHVTNDGGSSWISRSLGLDDEILATPSVSTAAMRFLDESHGVLVLSLRGQPDSLTALRTADGGQSWSQEQIPVEPGVIFLTHDAELLTVTPGVGRDIVVLRY